VKQKNPDCISGLLFLLGKHFPYLGYGKINLFLLVEPAERKSDIRGALINA
jgi:hypothetical protein